MKNIEIEEAVGDNKNPPLKPQSDALRGSVDGAAGLPAQGAAPLKVMSQAASAAHALGAQASTPADCLQKLWFSFFFDGTGNNMYADEGTLKHSNVAKLYRVHKPDSRVNGIYRLYIPGVGTYFKDVHDDGGSTPGLVAGSMGDARINWALRQFDLLMVWHRQRAISPKNRIIEVNIAVYGFSRGAALARAFSNDFLSGRGTVDKAGKWTLNNSSARLRIRFLGLFDTVASSGVPMSGNNTSIQGTLKGVERAIQDRLTDSDYAATLPSALAFDERGRPGADPAPGKYDGHKAYGGRQAINTVVEDVRHFIAAHEIRNSFPVESVSLMENGKISKPAHFHEYVFPGAHSDVGGSYRPGEGGRSDDPSDKLGLITLHQMYQYSMSQQVPLLPVTAWSQLQKIDFKISPDILRIYNHYQKKVAAASNVGALLNSHMALYFAWRFQNIQKKMRGDRAEADRILKTSRSFEAERAALDQEIKTLAEKDQAAYLALENAKAWRDEYQQSHYADADKELKRLNSAVEDATTDKALSKDKLLVAKSKRDALPNMVKFNTFNNMYDKRLMEDVAMIRNVYLKGGAAKSHFNAKDLRPHYKVMIEAYENEFLHHSGMTDPDLIDFFDNYVHDSLSGFAYDATLPSDPRVVYLGDDEKYRYAQIKAHDEHTRLELTAMNERVTHETQDTEA
jgi:hypothetical protein